MYVPRFWEFLRRARADRIDLVHLTTPGPIGLAALFVAWRLRLPLVGSFHTDLAAYATLLSGSRRLGALMREYMRWPYGKCARVLVPSEHTRQLLISAKANPDRIDVWPRGVDTDLFSPAKRSAALRENWHVSDRRPGAPVCRARLVARRGCCIFLPSRIALHTLGIEHRCIIVGDGPLLPDVARSRCRMRCSPVRCPGRRSPRHLPRLIALCFRARPTRPATSSSKHRPAACRSSCQGSGGPRENMVAGQHGHGVPSRRAWRVGRSHSRSACSTDADALVAVGTAIRAQPDAGNVQCSLSTAPTMTSTTARPLRHRLMLSPRRHIERDLVEGTLFRLATALPQLGSRSSRAPAA